MKDYNFEYACCLCCATKFIILENRTRIRFYGRWRCAKEVIAVTPSDFIAVEKSLIGEQLGRDHV